MLLEGFATEATNLSYLEMIVQATFSKYRGPYSNLPSAKKLDASGIGKAYGHVPFHDWACRAWFAGNKCENPGSPLQRTGRVPGLPAEGQLENPR